MANIKLTDHNWHTSGIFDTNQSKSQATINSDVATKIGSAALNTTAQNLSGGVNELKGRADTADTKIDDMIIVSNTQPSSQYNELWLPQTVGEGTSVPTWAEHQALESRVDAIPNIPNPNLLDNWYFLGGGSQGGAGKFPINQRGQTSYSGGVYCVDRWKVLSTMTASLPNANGINLKATSVDGAFIQFLDGIKTGEWYNLTFLFNDGSYVRGSAQVPSSPTAYNYYINATSSDGKKNAKFYINGANQWCAQLSFTSTGINTDFLVTGAKLENGNKQTLFYTQSGTIFFNEIPNYQEQLVRCIGSHGDSTDTYANFDYSKVFKASYTTTGLTVNGNATIANGGYAKIGNLVVVNIRLSISSSISANTALITGLPSMLVGATAVSFYTSDAKRVYMEQAGTLKSSDAIPSGTTIISFVYLNI